MTKITFNILYWNGSDSETRLKNVEYCWKKINKFSDYSNSKGMSIVPLLFDFSETNELPGSIHIPYKNGEFKKSEKINKVIEYNYLHNKPDIFCFLDNDVFFLESEYDKLIDELINFDMSSMKTCGVLDIQNSGQIDFPNNSFSAINIDIKPRLMNGLGAFYIIGFDNIFKTGGFDERFTCWGGEDDEIGYRLNRNGIRKEYTKIQLFHLPHKSMENDSKNEDQYNLQCRLISNNEKVTKFSIITDKYLKNND
jgi:hypothetical protein